MNGIVGVQEWSDKFYWQSAKLICLTQGIVLAKWWSLLQSDVDSVDKLEVFDW